MMVWHRSRTKALTTHPMSSLLPTTMIQSCARPSRTLKLTRWLPIKKHKSLRYTSREAPRPFSLRSKAVMKKTWMIKRLSWPRSSSIRLSNSLPSCTKKFPICRPWSHLANLPTYRSWKSARFSSSLIAFQTSSQLNDRQVARQYEIKQNLTHTQRGTFQISSVAKLASRYILSLLQSRANTTIDTYDCNYEKATFAEPKSFL